MATIKVTHYVYHTAFHGGGLVSRHLSRAAADRAVRMFQRGVSCTCGCVLVVPAAEVNDLPEASEAASPYEAAR